MLGGLESRGVLRKISDMLEVIMKRMDSLSKLENANDSRRLEELSSAINRYRGTAKLWSSIHSSGSHIEMINTRQERLHCCFYRQECPRVPETT